MDFVNCQFLITIYFSMFSAYLANRVEKWEILTKENSKCI